MDERERLHRALAGESVDRPPVVCPGGMMCAAVREVMRTCGRAWPDVHRDAAAMTDLALATREATGLENLGVPFCMTVESEAWGGEIEDGDETTSPSVYEEPLESVRAWTTLRELDPHRDGRMPVLVDCTQRLRARAPEVPVTANLVGPLSLATSLVPATTAYRELLERPADVHAFCRFLTRNSIRYGEALVRAGADVVVIADPASTGEILGPRLFREFAMPYLEEMTAAAHALGVPVVVHICGNTRPILRELAELSADALSVDSALGIAEVRHALRGRRVMGNVSTALLQDGDADRVRRAAARAIENGVDVLAPACGVSATTPVANLRAMTAAAREAR
jgi:[methyl-Co(III) methanol-specific corrinoid protein]:coenzyme M methyltransferase